MTKTAYYEFKFVTLHQKNPGYNIGNNSGNPYLSVGGIDTFHRKYSLEFGFGDPGEKPSSDTFDYPEFQIGSVTWQKPSDYDAKFTWVSEMPNGATITHTEKKWYSLSVPDNYTPGAGTGAPLPPYDGPLTQNGSGLWGTFRYSGNDIVSNVTFDGSTKAVGTLSIGKFNATTEDSLYTALGKLGTAYGLSQFTDAVKNASTIRETVAGIVDNGFALVNSGITGLSNANYKSGDFQAEADKFFKDTTESVYEAAEKVTFFPGNQQAEAVADRLISGARYIYEINSSGVVSATASVSVGVEVQLPGLGSVDLTFEGTAKLDIVFDGDKASTINLGDGGDIADGGYGNDRISGGGGNDRMRGGHGNDWLDGGAGSDLIDGSNGFDTARQAGNYRDHSIKFYSDGVISLARDGDVDLFKNVERLQFDDGILARDTASGENAGNAYRIYKAAFDREPDVQGVTFWTKWLDDGKTDTWNMAARFIDSNEFRALYGSSTPDDADFLLRVYRNVLDRDPDQGGYDFWLKTLTSDQYSQSEVLARFSDSLENRQNVAPTIEKGFLMSNEYFLF